jgi:hypothetical protein
VSYGYPHRHTFIIGITDSPLSRACRETEETVIPVLLECNTVAHHRAAHLGIPGSLQEVMRNIKALPVRLPEHSGLVVMIGVNHRISYAKFSRRFAEIYEEIKKKKH